MPTNPHPLQTALDRATAAMYTAIDLLDIASERKPVNEEGRPGRTDTRQVSLYGAIISSCIGAIEEAFEALTLAGLANLGVPAAAMSRLAYFIGRSMQSPSRQNLDKLMDDFLGFRPSDHWAAHLAHSPAVYRRSKLKDQSLDYRMIFTTYDWFSLFTKVELNDILDRFVRIRNYFAHQDASVKIFDNKDRDRLKALCGRKARSDSEVAFVEGLSATCAVTLSAKASPTDDPVVRWTLHETHPRNALFLCIGIVVSTCDALALHLQSSGIVVSSYDRLLFRVQDGQWSGWCRDHRFETPNVGFELIDYRPTLR